MPSIDLNADIGESFGVYRAGQDEELLQWVTSANVACGFHAGDPVTMRRTVGLCLERGASIGAHPGFPDLQGFGRRELRMAPDDACAMVIYQIGALQAFVRSEGGVLRHVKPHGALYNMAARDERLAGAIAEAVLRVDPGLMLFGLSGSKLVEAGKRAGLRTVSEVFADRTYRPDGSLTPREQSGALIEDGELAARQVLNMLRRSEVIALDGSRVPIAAETVCLHGDGKEAVQMAARLRTHLEKEGITVHAPA